MRLPRQVDRQGATGQLPQHVGRRCDRVSRHRDWVGRRRDQGISLLLRGRRARPHRLCRAAVAVRCLATPPLLLGFRFTWPRLWPFFRLTRALVTGEELAWPLVSAVWSEQGRLWLPLGPLLRLTRALVAGDELAWPLVSTALPG